MKLITSFDFFKQNRGSYQNRGVKKMNIYIKGDLVKQPEICKICEGAKPNAMHLRHKHGLEYEEYLKEYEEDYYYFKKTAEKVYELYLSDVKSWISQNNDGTYSKYDSNYGKKKIPFNKSMVKKHLTGRVTYGVWFKEYTTRFMGIDIDIKPQNGGLDALEELIDLLHLKGIKDAYLPTYSGNKGFHLDVFFKDSINKEYADKIYEYLLDKTGYNSSQIELRGGKNNTSGYKLPLGVHQKTKNRCDLVKVDNPKLHKSHKIGNYKHIYQRLEEIEPLSLDKIKDIVGEDKTQDKNGDKKIDKEDIKKDTNKIAEWDHSYKNKTVRERIEQIEKRGLVRKHTRHRTAAMYASLLDKIGCPKEAIEKKLKEWHKTLDERFYDSSKKECWRDYEELAEYVTSNENTTKIGREYVTEYPSPSPDEFKDIILKPDKISHIKVLYALVCHAIAFSDENNTFYMTYKQIKSITNTNNRRKKIKEIIEDLQKQGLVEIVRENEKREGTFYKKANKYKVPDLNREASELDEKRIPMCSPDNKQCDKCYRRMIKTMLTDEEIEDMTSGILQCRLKYTKECKIS